MKAFTCFALGALVTACLGGTAAAEEFTGPRVVGTGDNGSLEYPSPSQNIVGGALTQVVGAGEAATTEVIEVQSQQRPGGIAHVVGSGDNASIVYDPLPWTGLMAGFGEQR